MGVAIDRLAVPTVQHIPRDVKSPNSPHVRIDVRCRPLLANRHADVLEKIILTKTIRSAIFFIHSYVHTYIGAYVLLKTDNFKFMLPETVSNIAIHFTRIGRISHTEVLRRGIRLVQ